MFLRRAAVIVLLIGSAAAPPVRAFVTSIVSYAWSSVFEARQSGISGDGALRDDGALPTEISTVVDGPVLRIRLAGPGATDASVRLSPTDRPESTAAVGGSPDAEVTVAGDGFRITGITGASTVDLLVPLLINRVEIVRGTEEATAHPAPRDTPVTVRPGGR